MIISSEHWSVKLSVLDLNLGRKKAGISIARRVMFSICKLVIDDRKGTARFFVGRTCSSTFFDILNFVGLFILEQLRRRNFQKRPKTSIFIQRGSKCLPKIFGS